MRGSGFSPWVQFIIFLLKVLQFLHPLDFLLCQRVHALPRVVDVGPALPLNQVMSLPFILLGVKAFARVAIFLHGVHSSASPSGYKRQRWPLDSTESIWVNIGLKIMRRVKKYHLLFCQSWRPLLSRWFRCRRPAAPHTRHLSFRSGHQSPFQSHVGPLYN